VFFVAVGSVEGRQGPAPTVNEPHTVVDLIENWLWALDPGRET
jgi:hypothetical protein